MQNGNCQCDKRNPTSLSRILSQRKCMCHIFGMSVQLPMKETIFDKTQYTLLGENKDGTPKIITNKMKFEDDNESWEEDLYIQYVPQLRKIVSDYLKVINKGKTLIPQNIDNIDEEFKIDALFNLINFNELLSDREKKFMKKYMKKDEFDQTYLKIFYEMMLKSIPSVLRSDMIFLFWYIFQENALVKNPNSVGFDEKQRCNVLQNAERVWNVLRINHQNVFPLLRNLNGSSKGQPASNVNEIAFPLLLKKLCFLFIGYIEKQDEIVKI